jgi:hypothetical protein
MQNADKSTCIVPKLCRCPTKPRWFLAVWSNLEKTRRYCLSLPKKHSIKCRSCYISISYSYCFLRLAFAGITATAPMSWISSRNLSASNPLSTITCSVLMSWRSSCALVISWHCPPVSNNRSGLPSASTRAWILVVRPPRERPRAYWSKSPLSLHCSSGL